MQVLAGSDRVLLDAAAKCGHLLSVHASLAGYRPGLFAGALFGLDCVASEFAAAPSPGRRPRSVASRPRVACAPSAHGVVLPLHCGHPPILEESEPQQPHPTQRPLLRPRRDE